MASQNGDCCFPAKRVHVRILQYKDLDLRRVRPAFDKVRAATEADDFRSADVKKLHAGPYYRAKLDYATLPAFTGWCDRHRQALRLLGGPSGAMDPQALFEEFRGVIGAQPGGPLSLAD